MRRRPPGALSAVIVALALLSGCGIKKNLAFGTATKFGLDISQRPDQTIDVTMGYDRFEIASIPAPDSDDARANEDTYAVIGTLFIGYDNPWAIWNDPPLRVNQVFATGWAARKAARDSALGRFYGKKAGEIRARQDAESGTGGGR
jgi:hypothetical protein